MTIPLSAHDSFLPQIYPASEETLEGKPTFSPSQTACVIRHQGQTRCLAKTWCLPPVRKSESGEGEPVTVEDGTIQNLHISSLDSHPWSV